MHALTRLETIVLLTRRIETADLRDIPRQNRLDPCWNSMRRGRYMSLRTLVGRAATWRECCSGETGRSKKISFV